MNCVAPRCLRRGPARWRVAGEANSGFCGRCRVMADAGIRMTKGEPLRWERLRDGAVVALAPGTRDEAAYFEGEAVAVSKRAACLALRVNPPAEADLVAGATARDLLRQRLAEDEAWDVVSVVYHVRHLADHDPAAAKDPSSIGVIPFAVVAACAGAMAAWVYGPAASFILAGCGLGHIALLLLLTLYKRANPREPLRGVTPFVFFVLALGTGGKFGDEAYHRLALHLAGYEAAAGGVAFAAVVLLWSWLLFGERR